DRSAATRQSDSAAARCQVRRLRGAIDGSARHRPCCAGRRRRARTRSGADEMTNGAHAARVRRGVIASIALLVVFVAAWQWAPGALGVPSFIVPPLSDVAREFVRAWQVYHLPLHTGVTVAEVLVGFILGSLLGAVVGYLLGMSPTAELALSPYILALQIAPKV